MIKDEGLSAQGLEALRARFEEQSRKAQAYYAIMHKIREVVGSDEAASLWMEKPLAELEGKTPAQLVSENRTDTVLEYMKKHMKNLSP